MFPVPQHEKLIETKVCRQCQTSFPITDKDMELYDRLSPVFGNKKYSLPTAKICPDCRQKRRMAFRNERKLYRRNCDATGKEIISTYSPEAKVVVFHHDEWWSDKWDPLVYGKSFDFEKSFFEQFSALFSRVPKMGLLSFNNINSPYANYAANNKDIYMSPDILDSENVLYSNTIKKSTNCIDLLDVVDASECYECIGSQRVYNCQHVYWSADCTECYYVHGCHNVKNSLFCTNLNNKNYHILNKQSTKEEYEIVLQAIRTGQHGEYFKQYQQLLLSSPQKHLRTYQIENVSGDIIKESINCVSCFQSILLQDCRYVVTGYEMKNCMDTSIHNPNCEYDYEAISGGGLVRAICNNMCGYSDNLYYNNECLHGSHLFGCIGLRNKKYCILNKQYTKEEYEALVPKIIEKMIAD